MSASKRLSVAIVLLIVIFSSFAAFLIYLNAGSARLDISFIPDRLNSSPGEIGWFLVEIDTSEEITTYELDIQTNTSIDTDYVYWPQTPLLEIFLYPNSSHIDACIEVEVTLSVGDLIAHDSAFMLIWNWTFEELEEVIEKRDVFIDYLAANHPELGINETVSWAPIFNCAGILIVGHYLFKSSQWEMEIAWHVMIQPHDWVQVYLRPRAEIQPSWAGEIESWSTDNQTIMEIEPPAEIYRPM